MIKWGGGGVGADEESVNLNGSVGHEIRPEIPIRAVEKQVVMQTQVDSRTLNPPWKTELCDCPQNLWQIWNFAQ